MTYPLCIRTTVLFVDCTTFSSLMVRLPYNGCQSCSPSSLERSPTGTLHTVVIRAFYQVGGFDEILKVCTTLAKSIEEVVGIREEARSAVLNQTLSHAYTSLKVALHLLQHLVSAKSLFESPQTLLLVTRDKKETDPGFFDPNNFLVRIRLKVAPLLCSLWKAPWLLRAPLGVSKMIVRLVLELMNAENEQSKLETTTEAVPNFSRTTGPDENRVQVLIDMGFPRHAAERALTQTRNNVTTATEFLLSHPFAFASEPGSTPTPATSQPTDEGIEVTGDSLDVGETSLTAATEAGGAGDQPEEIRTVEEWKRALDQVREPLCDLVSRQILLLVDEHQCLLFEVQSAFLRNSPQQAQAVQSLVDDVKFFSPYAHDEQPLANRCRLLALVLGETSVSLDNDLRQDLLDSLLALLLSGVDTRNLPKWLASHLLVTEALLILADEPRTIILPKENEPINPEPLSTGIHRADAKNIIFEICLRLIADCDLASDELLSVLRLLVFFTKDRKYVKQFLDSNGLSHVFQRFAASEVTGGSSYVVIILRHIVEDQSIIHSLMSESIRKYFQNPRNSNADVSTYVRNCNAIALRDTDIFLKVTNSLCCLNQPYKFNPQITLQAGNQAKRKTGVAKDNSAWEEKKAEDAHGDVEMKIEIPASDPFVNDQCAEPVIHLLLSELMATVKNIHETSTSSKAGSSLPSTSIIPQIFLQKENTSSATNHDPHQYACFLMQCLIELLFSYDTCKIAFLSFSPKKKSQTPAKEPSSKFRSVTLQFLFNDIINPGTINPSPADPNHRYLSLCNWAMLMIVSICVDTSVSLHESKDISSDLVTVRKFVLETLSRSLKDISSMENLQVRYGKLLAYADLCHRLLTVRFNNTNTSGRKPQDEIPTHIAKIMLEKNFVSTLTNALSEVDLNYPHVRTLIDFILRPLQYLYVLKDISGFVLTALPQYQNCDQNEPWKQAERDNRS